MSKLVHVAVGVVKNSAGQILIAKRADDAHQGGLWEFPGGKVEPGESLNQALKRELSEELDINVSAIQPLIQISHHYPGKDGGPGVSVLLDVCVVDEFLGVAAGNEGQPIRWVAVDELGEYEFPAANCPIITALQLSDVMMITGEEGSTETVISKLKSALLAGVRLVQLRQSILSTELVSAVTVLCSEFGAQLQINTAPDDIHIGEGTGLHLASRYLSDLTVRPVATDILFGVSCHNEKELELAQAIGADYVLLSPVLHTRSHPNECELGWQRFSELVAECKVPVYALGGMDAGCLALAKSNGAQGVAGISAWWRD